MSETTADTLFAGAEDAPASESDFTTGILPSQGLREAIRGHEIQALDEVDEAQIQPASLDLRLGAAAYRVRASFLPGPEATVEQKLAELAMHQVDLTEGAVLEKGCVYIVPLAESLALKKRTSAIANPKSSTGRLDIFTRLITDGGAEFDRVRERYQGPLYAEISPRTFSVLVRKHSKLMQLRVKRGSPQPSEAALRRLHQEVGLVDSEPGAEKIKGGQLALTVDIAGEAGDGLIGYRARKHAGLIDIDRVGHYDPADFWEPVPARPGRGLILDPDDFYILASKEAVTVPDDHAAEMQAYDTLVGEFRVHYAGFFDPGFGLGEIGAGTRAVLEVRSHEVPFLLEDGQIVGRLVYERLTAKPDKLYGRDIGSSYQRQGLALGKQFKR
jgi:dCTP deaminase